MKYLIALVALLIIPVFADPGIMIDIDIVPGYPTGGNPSEVPITEIS